MADFFICYFCCGIFTKARFCLGLLRYEINMSSIKKVFYGNFLQRPSEFLRSRKVLKKYLEAYEKCGLQHVEIVGVTLDRVIEKKLKKK